MVSANTAYHGTMLIARLDLRKKVLKGGKKLWQVEENGKVRKIPVSQRESAGS